MSREVDRVRNLNSEVPLLMGASEVAAELGVATPNIDKVANLPAPIPQKLQRGRLWRADVIRRFAAKRREKGAANGTA